jgi:DNA helicase-2/ATP-dependent DNA helicase PcrA
MELDTSLNEQQKIAVNHIEGPLLVLAGAGSGKTRIVILRIVHLLEIGVPANEILAVTFTNKAADEMRKRIQKLASTQPLTCTFHSLCARILRESIAALGYKSHFHIFDEEDSEKVLKQCLEELHKKDDRSLLKTVRAAISSAKNNLLESEKIEEEDPFLL